MFDKDVKLDFHDLRVKPAIISEITSRSEINPYYQHENGEQFLPIFTAPMDTVIDNNNWEKFTDNKIHAIIPRGEHQDSFGSEKKFKSLSLDEFISQYINIDEMSFYFQMLTKNYVLIDMANGHMKKLLETIKTAKEKYKENLVLMVGNIANPETYKKIAKAGADFIRIGIGNGCFSRGMKITTKAGEKNIEDINEQDEVLTHKNRFKKVLNTKKINYSGEMIKINDDIICTPTHEFYVLNKKYLHIVNDDNLDKLCEWISASQFLENSDYLLLENNKSPKDDKF